ncbi:MAG: DUF4249 domain-containing protein [Flavobacteriales bacterium]|nr:DUF4249 domain-containing protein [Flavobacteriales bacterium]
MMRLKNYTWLLVLLANFVACTPEPIDIDLPQADPKLVVYSQALPNQALIVTLSKSFSALSSPNENNIDSTQQDSINNLFLNQFLVDNAIITIQGADYNDTLLRVTKGVFVAPLFPFTPGNSYQLNAHDPVTGFSVSSNATTLPIVGFDTISAKRGSGEDSLEITLNYKVNDPVGENYYLVNVYTDSIPQNNFFSFDSNSEGNSISFSDREFAQGKVEREDKFQVTNTDTLVVSITNISKEYFDFLEARKRSGNSFLSEPIEYPSNIINGLGYFNLHAPSASVIEIK